MSIVEDSLSLKQFSARLLDLHAQAKTQSLSGPDRAVYERVRDDLARMLVFAQQLTCRPGEKFRQALRVAVELPVTIDAMGQHAEGSTLNVSAGGFAAKLSRPLDTGVSVDVAIVMPFGEPVNARARVVAAAATTDGCRASFAFQELDPSTLDRIEVLVFDKVLPQLSSLLELGGPRARGQ